MFADVCFMSHVFFFTSDLLQFFVITIYYDILWLCVWISCVNEVKNKPPILSDKVGIYDSFQKSIITCFSLPSSCDGDYFQVGKGELGHGTFSNSPQFHSLSVTVLVDRCVSSFSVEWMVLCLGIILLPCQHEIKWFWWKQQLNLIYQMIHVPLVQLSLLLLVPIQWIVHKHRCTVHHP